MYDGPILGELARRMIALAIFGSALIVAWSQGTQCSFADEQLSSGSSSKRFRTETIQSLPYHLLNQVTKDKISEVLENPSVYRRLPVTSIDADPDYFRFLTRYPEVVVGIWQLMGITNMTTERTGPYSISSNDGAGTISELELVYGDQNLHIFYGTGTYEGPILKRKLSGQCVLVLKAESRPDNNGHPVTTSQLDVFLKIENATAGLVAKTIQPLVGTTADYNFVQSLKFVQRLNETTEKNGPGVQQMGDRLNLSPDVRQKFHEVANLVFQRAVNASVPDDARTSVTPSSFESRYNVPVNPPSRLSRPANVMPQAYPTPSRQGPAFESLRDSGQNFSYPRLPQPSVPALDDNFYDHPRYVDQPNLLRETENALEIPPRGFQAPGYLSRAAWYTDNDYQFEPGVIQTRFDEYGRPLNSNHSPSPGWKPRR